MFPTVLEKLFSREETRPDYIALDLKMAPERYANLANSSHGGTSNREPELRRSAARGEEPGKNLIKSAALIRSSGIDHEYRTLALPGDYINNEDIEALAPLADNGPWYFRPFVGGNCLDPAWDTLEEPATEAHARLEALVLKAREMGKMGKAMGIRV